MIQAIVTNNCPDEEKGCSAKDLVKIESCRVENLLSNGIKYVMPNYLLFIDILGKNP